MFLCLPEMQGVVYFGINVPNFTWVLLAGAAVREASAHALAQEIHAGNSYFMACLAAPLAPSSSSAAAQGADRMTSALL